MSHVPYVMSGLAVEHSKSERGASHERYIQKAKFDHLGRPCTGSLRIGLFRPPSRRGERRQGAPKSFFIRC